MLSILGASLSYLVFVHRLPAHAVYSAIMLFLQSILSLQHTLTRFSWSSCQPASCQNRKFMHRKHVYTCAQASRGRLVAIASESQSQISVSLLTQPARYIVPKMPIWFLGGSVSVRAPCSNERCRLLCTCTTVLLIE